MTQWPYPDPSQRVAIAEHLVWMMDFLHHHHHAEGEGLYPPVRQRVPESIPVLDAMDADHQTMIPAIDRLDAAAKTYATDAQARTEVVAALDELSAVMLPHLDREENEMMPIVAAAIGPQRVVADGRRQ